MKLCEQTGQTPKAETIQFSLKMKKNRARHLTVLS